MTLEKCRACKGSGEQQGGPGDGAQCLQCGGAGRVRVVGVNDAKYNDISQPPKHLNARYGDGWYFCWLIEKRGLTVPLWLDAKGDWTNVAHKALWFARKEDAEEFRVAYEHDFVRIVVCEHGFMLEKPTDD